MVVKYALKQESLKTLRVRMNCSNSKGNQKTGTLDFVEFVRELILETVRLEACSFVQKVSSHRAYVKRN